MASYIGPNTPPIIIIIKLSSYNDIVTNMYNHKNNPNNYYYNNIHINNNNNDLNITMMPNEGKDYLNLYTYFMTEPLPDSIYSYGLLKQIRKGDFVYIYMSTNSVYDLPFAVGHCLVLGPNEVNRFLGPYREMYKVAAVAEATTATATSYAFSNAGACVAGNGTGE